MTTIKELSISSIAEPASVKIEKNSKGCNYELGIHAVDFNTGITEILVAKQRLDMALFGVYQEAKE